MPVSEQPILYVDEFLVVVDKPSGVAVHRSDRVRDDVVAMTMARDAIGRRVYPVHRLDRGTSGILLFALSAEIAAILQREFENRRVEKSYIALVRGVPPERIRVDHPVPRARKSKERLPAVTDLRCLGTWRDRYSLVEARPLTGRHHQIRRHLKHLSCPLIGDVHYGKGEHNRFFRNTFGLHRLALHALSLELRHPVSGVLLELRAEPSGDLARVLEEMGLRRPPARSC